MQMQVKARSCNLYGLAKKMLYFLLNMYYSRNE